MVCDPADRNDLTERGERFHRDTRRDQPVDDSLTNVGRNITGRIPGESREMRQRGGSLRRDLPESEQRLDPQLRRARRYDDVERSVQGSAGADTPERPEPGGVGRFSPEPFHELVAESGPFGGIESLEAAQQPPRLALDLGVEAGRLLLADANLADDPLREFLLLSRS